MSNFKSGSGDLDFGGADDSDDADSDSNDPEEENASGASAADSAETDTPERPESAASETTTTYPYFVRRNNVGDERDTRLEIHVRNKVTDQEPEFRNELAAALDTDEVSKTDAREYALLAAYRNPEQVAALMRDDGFDAV